MGRNRGFGGTALGGAALLLMLGSGVEALAGTSASKASAPSSAQMAHALLFAQSWSGTADVRVTGPSETKLTGPKGSAQLGQTQVLSTAYVTFHLDKLVKSGPFSATWAGIARWDISEHEHGELTANGHVGQTSQERATGSVTTKATFSINFPEETGKGPGNWSIDPGDPSIHYTSTVTDISGHTETYSGKGPVRAVEHLHLSGRLPANGYIHGTKVDTRQSRMAAAKARAEKVKNPQMKALELMMIKSDRKLLQHPYPGTSNVYSKAVMHWAILPNPCSTQTRTVSFDTPLADGLRQKGRIVLDEKPGAGAPPSTAQFKVSVDIQPNAYWRLADDVLWDVYSTHWLVAKLNPDPGMRCSGIGDCNTDVRYYGMPIYNSAFGSHVSSVSLPILASCVKPRKLKLTYFYARDGIDNPEGKGQSNPPVPNWFHYWSKTAAVQHFSPLEIMYDGSRGECFRKRGFIAGYFAWRPEDADDVHLCDGLVRSPWGNPFTGRVTTGIDAYATTLLHEFAHKRHYHKWWLTIDQAIAESGRQGNTRMVKELKAERKAMDEDGDDIPDRLECRRRKNGAVYCPRWPGKPRIWAGIKDSCGIHDTDEHCLIYRHDQMQWRIGSANKEDWSCPGKQSGQLCPRRTTSVAPAPDATNGEPSLAYRRITAVRVDPASLSTGTEKGEAQSAAEGDDPPAPHLAAYGDPAAPATAVGRAASLLESANPLEQLRGLHALSRLADVKPAQKLHLMLPAFKLAVTNPNPVQVRHSTGFLPQQDWVKLQYLRHVAALGSAAVSPLRKERAKSQGLYREYLTLALAAAGEKQAPRLLAPLVRTGSTWVIRQQAVLLIGERAGRRADVQKLLKATLHDSAEVYWRSDVGGASGFTDHVYPVRDAAALMLIKVGYSIKRTADGGYVAIWTPAVPRLATASRTAAAAKSASRGGPTPLRYHR